MRGLKRRRGIIDGDPGLRQLRITIRLYATSGNIRAAFFEGESEESLEQADIGVAP